MKFKIFVSGNVYAFNEKKKKRRTTVFLILKNKYACTKMHSKFELHVYYD